MPIRASAGAAATKAATARLAVTNKAGFAIPPFNLLKVVLMSRAPF
jgi:hypothetical protein